MLLLVHHSSPGRKKELSLLGLSKEHQEYFICIYMSASALKSGSEVVRVTKGLWSNTSHMSGSGASLLKS